jgi:hypothetical protein
MFLSKPTSRFQHGSFHIKFPLLIKEGWLREAETGRCRKTRTIIYSSTHLSIYFFALCPLLSPWYFNTHAFEFFLKFSALKILLELTGFLLQPARFFREFQECRFVLSDQLADQILFERGK